MTFKRLLTIIFLSILGFTLSHAVELPKPTYDNSIMFSWTHNFRDTAEVEYIKSQFGNGLYAPLMFSGFYGVNMAWHVNLANSSNSINDFKATMGELVAFAKANKVGIHLTLSYGLARYVYQYTDAKIEDIRNAQWYNDNNISSQAQQGRLTDTESSDEERAEHPSLETEETSGEIKTLDSPSASSVIVNKYVFTTLSRYARKVRTHLNAKIAAAFAYLKQVQSANPDIFIVVSAPGEPELNYYRLNDNVIQEYFCDYSPFSVLEFRDWIQHTGLYADGQKYAADRYNNGGSKYQGATGLAKFNSDFGTSFGTWSLKYYNWNLTDAEDTVYEDAINPDVNVIPIAQYVYNGMKPTAGAKYIANGFDPPRVMQAKGVNHFYDLWHTFREKSVYFYVKDMTDVARASGFPKSQYYTHQIPADYLFGTKPTDANLNPRYYSSASPLWAGNNYSDNGTGVTIYDIKYPDWFARTSQYSISASAAISDNWAALEYHPEVIPLGVASEISSVATIYEQMIRLYEGHPHVISFFKWVDTTPATSEYRYKGNNRETAVKQFFDAIKDKARQPLATVFTPKQVEAFSAAYNSGMITLSWSPKIWTDLLHLWTNWGQFKEFAIYRGYTADFVTNNSSLITTTTASTYIDFSFKYKTTVYYKILAFNTSGQPGPVQTVFVVTPEGAPAAVLAVSRTRLNFGGISGGNNPPAQSFRISNQGGGALNWNTTSDVPWLTCTPASGLNSGDVSVAVNATGLAAGEYNGTITVAAPPAIDSPKVITIYLSVKNSGQNQVPFGSFDSPADSATVQSSIAVTGWVLDDIGVDSVKLYRDPVDGEGGGLIAIGSALFVDGARPDIEAAYPNYPQNYKAGWGYMLLTNFFPNNGNGTFTLHVRATDTSGNEVSLGSKMIIVNNAAAIKPFGALDTPTQGGIASGSSFINWGWALTPQPNKIPINGSTIDVWVDGLKIGHPTYNLYREDIGTLFPSYANSSGAIGYFPLNTTTLSEGVHTIQWTALDNAGNTDGIGSRYFTVQRNAADIARAKSNAGKNLNLSNWVEANKTPDSIRVEKGFPASNKTPEQTLILSSKGKMTVEILELERLVITPGSAVSGTRWTAAQLVGSQVRELPIGSTFDPRTGTLFWQPGQGFMGDYTIRFTASNDIVNKTKAQQILVKIKILPKFGKTIQPVKAAKAEKKNTTTKTR